MTPAEQAAKAIKDATGWDAHPGIATSHKSLHWTEAKAESGTTIALWYDDAKKWQCYISSPAYEHVHRLANTPEDAVRSALSVYRAHIAALAADILPGWPRLEWTGQPYARTLCLTVGGFMERILTVYPERTVWAVSIDNVTGPQRTREAVLAAVAAHVESLALPCPLPPFPGASDA